MAISSAHLAGSGLDPLGILEDQDMRQALVGSIETLPEREKMMMALYYERT